MSHLYLFLLSGFLVCYESQKLPYDLAVLHDGLHVDRLTVCEHLIAQATDRTIPDREKGRCVINMSFSA